MLRPGYVKIVFLHFYFIYALNSYWKNRDNWFWLNSVPLLQSSASRGSHIVNTWVNQTERRHYRYLITRNDSYTFTWVFQKVQWDADVSAFIASPRLLAEDMAKIYLIKVSNTLDGGVQRCINCNQVRTELGFFFLSGNLLCSYKMWYIC